MVAVLLDRDCVTGVVRVLCQVQIFDCLTARNLCLGQILSYVMARVCLVARDLCLGQILRCHCLISCITDGMYTLGFGQVPCFQVVLFRWDMLGFILDLADNRYC